MTGLCDNCNYITDIKYKEEQLSRGIKHTYFVCEHCNKRYTCFVTDPKVRQLQKKIRRLTGHRNRSVRIRMMELVNERMTELKQEITNEQG
ncbi:hypothetical protein [Virgibacillus ndiopensis]|uniref:hypothetical protein n=1 Tax=Virgibacillus ndiopensis TaxID=2004408 RepID=UPI000C089315|nr:hypothetical protein [Virgibacillus ndiopensis]